MLHIFGCPIPPELARNLVATLFADGSPDSIAAAEMIGNALDHELEDVILDARMRDTVLSVLEEPPGELAELRGKLARDQRNRQD